MASAMEIPTDLSDLPSSSSGNSPLMERRRQSELAQKHDSEGEFWAILGPEWSTAKVLALATGSDKAYFSRLLNTIPNRPIEFAEGFFDLESNTMLSQKHLYGALVYTRGDIEHVDPCLRCRTPGKRVFPKCVSLKLMAQGACAADIWISTTSECDYHSENVLNAKEQSKTGEADGSVDRKQIRASTRVGTTHIPGTQAHVVSTRAAKQKSITPSPIASVLSTARYQDGAGFDNDGDIEEIQDPSILQNTKHKIRKAISKKKNSPWNSLARKASTTMATKLDSPRSADLLTQRLFPSVNASPISNFPALSTSDSGYKDGNSGIASQRRRRREGDHSEDERPTRRPRLEQPLIRDTLEYLQGDFDYGAAELALEVTPDMIQEAKAMNRIQVGPYLLCRFRVEMNVMWAVRVATARWAQKLHS